MFKFDWTDIKLGLPKEKGKYLVTIDEGRFGTVVEIADFDGKDFYQIGLDDQEYGLTFCILAWGQLPEPYSKEVQ